MQIVKMPKKPKMRFELNAIIRLVAATVQVIAVAIHVVLVKMDETKEAPACDISTLYVDSCNSHVIIGATLPSVEIDVRDGLDGGSMDASAYMNGDLIFDSSQIQIQETGTEERHWYCHQWGDVNVDGIYECQKWTECTEWTELR